VRAVPAVVDGVLVEHHAQLALAEDEHPVGDLGPDRADEPFGVGIRRGHCGGILIGVMPAQVRTVSNDVVYCPARSRIRTLNAVVRLARFMSRLPAAWVVPRPVGVGRDDENMDETVGDLDPPDPCACRKYVRAVQAAC
jgi:hypothetical protein